MSLHQQINQNFNQFKPFFEKVISKCFQSGITLTQSTPQQDLEESIDGQFYLGSNLVDLSIRERDFKWFGYNELTIRKKSPSGKDVEWDKLIKFLPTKKHQHLYFYFYYHFNFETLKYHIDKWYIIDLNEMYRMGLLQDVSKTNQNQQDEKVFSCYDLDDLKFWGIILFSND